MNNSRIPLQVSTRTFTAVNDTLVCRLQPQLHRLLRTYRATPKKVLHVAGYDKKTQFGTYRQFHLMV